MNFQQQLADAGLVIRLFDVQLGPLEVDEVEAQPCRRYSIAKLAKEPHTSRCFLGRLPVEDFILHLVWEAQFAQWVLSLFSYIPGPGPTDFMASFATLEAIAPVVINYYFGQNAEVNGWTVPLHRHPELSYQSVYQAIGQAVSINADTFKRIAKERYHVWESKLPNEAAWNRESELPNAVAWEWLLQCQFLKIAHASEAAQVLQLRRDLKEVYIVPVD